MPNSNDTIATAEDIILLEAHFAGAKIWLTKTLKERILAALNAQVRKSTTKYVEVPDEMVAQLSASWSSPVRMKIVSEDGNALSLAFQRVEEQRDIHKIVANTLLAHKPQASPLGETTCACGLTFMVVDARAWHRHAAAMVCISLNSQPE
jgi:hypothetical protein